ncbi:MAG: hypothetical protein ABS910_03400 [Arthrobacter sp.]
METNGPYPDANRASADLSAVRRGQDAIRSLPWPWWLYTGNGTLLGIMALLPLLGSPTGAGLLVVLVLGLVLFNYWAGSRMGAPYAVPRNRVFLAAVALSALFLTGSIAAAGVGQTGLVWLCAGGTVLSYALGSLVHYRGTRA